MSYNTDNLRVLQIFTGVELALLLLFSFLFSYKGIIFINVISVIGVFVFIVYAEALGSSFANYHKNQAIYQNKTIVRTTLFSTFYSLYLSTGVLYYTLAEGNLHMIFFIWLISIITIIIGTEFEINKRIYRYNKQFQGGNRVNKGFIELCKNVDDFDLEKFEEGCLNITDLEETFGDEIEENEGWRDQIEVFDKVLEANVSSLKEDTLSHLIKLSFNSDDMTDSYELTKVVLDEIVQRGALGAQEVMAKAFVDAQCYYDAGHRYYGDTIQDLLIEDYLGDFGEAPLSIVLLETANSLFLSGENYGDELGILFYFYFRKAKDKDTIEKVWNRYKSYILEEIKYTDEDSRDEIMEEIEGIKENELIKEKVEELLNFISLYTEGFIVYEEEKTMEFFTHLASKEGLSYLEALDWDFAFDGEELEEGFGLSFDIAYLLFCKYALATFEENDKGKSFFLTLLYLIDKDKLKERVVMDFDDSSLIKGTRKSSSFAADNVYYITMEVLAGMIGGKTEEEVLKEREERIAKEEERRREIALERSLKKALNEKFEEAKEGMSSLEAYIAISEEYSKEHNEKYDLPIVFANFSTKLIISALQNGDISFGKKVYDSYVDVIIPNSGLSIKSTDVASNSIVLGIYAKDDTICQRAIEIILGDDFTIETCTNDILLFNMACYYAINKDKDKLLPTIKKAIELGKSPEQFMTDNDFSTYHTDKEFLKVVNKG